MGGGGGGGGGGVPYVRGSQIYMTPAAKFSTLLVHREGGGGNNYKILHGCLYCKLHNYQDCKAQTKTSSELRFM